MTDSSERSSAVITSPSLPGAITKSLPETTGPPSIGFGFDQDDSPRIDSTAEAGFGTDRAGDAVAQGMITESEVTDADVAVAETCPESLKVIRPEVSNVLRGSRAGRDKIPVVRASEISKFAPDPGDSMMERDPPSTDSTTTPAPSLPQPGTTSRNPPSPAVASRARRRSHCSTLSGSRLAVRPRPFRRLCRLGLWRLNRLHT